MLEADPFTQGMIAVAIVGLAWGLVDHAIRNARQPRP